jgi:hypothetical protein
MRSLQAVVAALNEMPEAIALGISPAHRPDALPRVQLAADCPWRQYATGPVEVEPHLGALHIIWEAARVRFSVVLEAHRIAELEGLNLWLGDKPARLVPGRSYTIITEPTPTEAP